MDKRIKRPDSCINDNLFVYGKAVCFCCCGKEWIEGAEFEPVGYACKKCVLGKCKNAPNIKGGN
jgi:hypothetical protein